MPDANDENAVDYGASLDMIEEQIEAGLPLYADQLVRAYVNEEFYAGRNELFIQRREAEDWLSYEKRPKRTSKLTRKVVRKLTEHLYAPGPTRKLEGSPQADALLQEIYARNKINAVMTQADRKATLNGACLVGAVATGDPRKPIKLYVWGAHEYVAFSRPDDPTEPWAIVTIARERKDRDARCLERLRYEAWTRDEHRVYLTEWHDVPPSRTDDWARKCYRSLFGQSATYQYEMSGWSEAGVHHAGENPYGCLPFVVVTDETRVSSLCEGGIGDALVAANADLDRELSDLAAHVKEFMDPDRFLLNVSSSFRREKTRDRWQILPPIPGAKAGDTTIEPKPLLVQAELAVDQVWFNLRSYAESTIEDLDVPLTSVRADASTDLSGVAIVAKQLPLLQRVKQRQQEPFTQHECCLAEMVLTVYGNFYRDDAILAAAQDPKLTLIWPEPNFPLPTPERDAEDQADRESGRKSQVQIVAERYGVTPDQAKDVLERVVEDELWYADLLKRKGLVPSEPDPKSQDTQSGEATPPGEGPAEKNPPEELDADV